MITPSAVGPSAAAIRARGSKYLEGYLQAGDVLELTGLFSAAVYLRNPRGRLVMLHDARYGLVPFGLAVEGVRELIADARLRIGMSAVFDGGTLRLGRLSFAVEASSREVKPEAAPTLRELKSAERRALAALRACPKGVLKELLNGGAACENVFARAAVAPFHSLMTALTVCDAKGVDAALSGLIGLGPGLTPSMDDLLSAMCAALRGAKERWGLDMPCARLLSAAILARAQEGTGEISAAYLRSSASGEELERLDDLLRRLPELMSTGSIAALLEVGANSGADMLTGAIVVLRFIISRSADAE